MAARAVELGAELVRAVDHALALFNGRTPEAAAYLVAGPFRPSTGPGRNMLCLLVAELERRAMDPPGLAPEAVTRLDVLRRVSNQLEASHA